MSEKFPLAPVTDIKSETIDERFERLQLERKIAVTEDGLYIIARSTVDRAEAVTLCERLDLIHHWDRLKQECFINGMIDGIRTYMRELKKLGPLKAEITAKVGNEILEYISKERQKV